MGGEASSGRQSAAFFCFAVVLVRLKTEAQQGGERTELLNFCAGSFLLCMCVWGEKSIVTPKINL